MCVCVCGVGEEGGTNSFMQLIECVTVSWVVGASRHVSLTKFIWKGSYLA